MFFKSIFQGNLQFGNVKSFEKVIRMFDHRTENYYKNDVLFKSEEIFKQASTSVEIPRTVLNLSDKTWRNTVDLLTYVAQFAISGNIGAWMTEPGKILRYTWIEPEGDKAVVQTFRRGLALMDQEGKEEEAQKMLTKTIEIYDKHSQAYERRGHVNFLLKKYHDAERDFKKAITHDPDNTPAHYGIGRIKMMKEEWSDAIDAFTTATKTSLALQDLHWVSRRLKADCLIQLERYTEAEFELRFFTKREFQPNNQNYQYRKLAIFHYGRVLLQLKKYSEALAAFDQAMDLGDDRNLVDRPTLLFYRGLARKHAGKNGFIADWNEAAKLGSAEAINHLKQRKKGS